MENNGEEFAVTMEEPTVISRLNAFRKWGTYCDLVVHVGNRQFPCHRCILAATVPYFQIMFKYIECDKKEIELLDVNADAFQLILDYAYTGRLKLDTSKIVDIVILIPVADYLGLTHLLNKCLDIFKKNMKIDNIFDICACIERLKNNYVIEIVHNFVAGNFSSIYKSNKFVNLPHIFLINAIESDSVNVDDEEEVFHAVNKWIMYEPERIQYLDDLTKCIRINFISDRFLAAKLDKNSLLAQKVNSLKLKNRVLPNCPNRKGKLIYFFGTSDAKDNIIKVVRYNTDFEYVPSMTITLPSRCVHRVVMFHNNLYHFSHMSESDANSFQYFDDRVEIWKQLAVPHHPVYRGSVDLYNMVALNDINCIYANCSISAATVFCYVQDRNQWLTVDTNRTNCWTIARASMVAHGNIIYMLGGFDGGVSPVSNVFAFDPRIGMWNKVTPMPKKRGFSSSACMNDKLYVTGGTNKPDDFDDFHIYKSMLVFDVRANKWISGNSMINTMYSHSMVTFNGKLWSIDTGGLTNNYSVSEKQWNVCPSIKNYLEANIVAIAN